MRWGRMICAVLIPSICALSQDHRPATPFPERFVVGRHTFFDFGPPTDFYELILVRSIQSGTSIERITFTPAVDACTQPAKIEVAVATSDQPIAAVLGNTNPCTIPERELHWELKRCKKCSVYSGAKVAMQAQCGSRTRIIRSDILDRDMFDPEPKTPEYTSWTMHLLERLDKALGPGVLDKPMFSFSEEGMPAVNLDPETMEELRMGEYDGLFQGAPDKLLDLYLAAQKRPPRPTVRLVSSSIQPEKLSLPDYPPLARAAHIEGNVGFKVRIDPDGSTTDFAIISGSKFLAGSVESAVKSWKFSKETAGQEVDGAIEFVTNCPAKPR